MAANTSLPRMAPVLIGLAVFLSVPGCGRKVTFAEVTGKVTLEGRPLAGVVVTFYPVTEGKEGLPYSSGTTDAEGNYRLQTVDAQLGAVVGQNRVVVNWPPRGERTDGGDQASRRKSPGPLLPIHYTVAATTPLIVDVKPGGAQTIDVPLPGSAP